MTHDQLQTTTTSKDVRVGGNNYEYSSIAPKCHLALLRVLEGYRRQHAFSSVDYGVNGLTKGKLK